MSKQAVIALDVGGTTIDSACVSIDGELIGDVRDSGSPAAGTRDEIVRELARVIGAARAQAGPAEVIACGISMPAPFDYPAGVSHMAHKFQAIRGLPLATLLAAQAGLPVYFLNDADAFGLGVGWRQLPGGQRFVALTIGTGLGSGFISGGRAIVIGGQVGRSLELLAPALRQALAGAGLPDLPVVPAAPGNMAIWGAARHAFTAAAV
jgi:glucokinase